MLHESSRDTGRAGARGRATRLNVVLACACVAGFAGVVTGFAWTRPTTTTSALSYLQTGRLSYSAAVRTDSIYGSSGLRSGEPVYANSVRALKLTFSYEFRGAGSAGMHGTEHLSASMNNGEGIARTIFSTPVTSFRGDRFTTTAVLRFSTMSALARAFATAAGAGTAFTYPVTVSPSVRIGGRLGPAAMATSFSPHIQFSYSLGVLALDPGASAGPGSLAPAGTTSAASAAGTLAPSSRGSLVLPSSKLATIGLRALTVIRARDGSLALLALALAIALIAGWPLLREAVSDDEAARSVARHGPALVEAATLPRGADMAIVELSSFAGLLQVSRRLECPILHERGPVDTYAVVDNRTLYRYCTAAATESSLHLENGRGRLSEVVTADGARR